MVPTISTPPPAPPARASSDDSSLTRGSNDYNYEDDHIQFSERTPLTRHSNRKREPPIFRSKQSYGAEQSVSMVGLEELSTFGSNSVTKNVYDDSCCDGDDGDDEKSLSTRSLTSIGSLTSITTVMENFRDGLATPFVDEEGSCTKISGGLGSLSIVGTFLGLVLPKDDNFNGQWYSIVSSVIGYNYFVLWSVCFYPQVLLNYRRKSTKGLSNDFAVLNFMGWFFYSAYVTSMYFDEDIKALYQERLRNESSTVRSNDVAFSVHAMILSFVYLVQIVYYGNGKPRKAKKGSSSGLYYLPLKPQTWVLVLGMAIPSAVVPLLIQFDFLAYSRWLDYFYVLSYFKICCTLTKYTKQVVFNWQRKSTKGWNIWYNFLECSGGALSMVQICLDSLNHRDITGITGNLAKFALGFATIFFDVS